MAVAGALVDLLNKKIENVKELKDGYNEEVYSCLVGFYGNRKTGESKPISPKSQVRR